MRIFVLHLLLWFPSCLWHFVIGTKNLDEGHCLPTKVLSGRSRICTGYFLYDRSSWSCIGSGSITCKGSRMYFHSCNIWNTLCTLRTSGGNSNWNATSPTLYMIGCGPMYVRRADFPWHTKSRKSLGWRNLKKHLISNLEFEGPTPSISVALLAAFIHSWITLILLVVAWINFGPIVRASSISC